MRSRMTQKNPGINTYRVPGHRVQNFRIHADKVSLDYFGNMIDKLGEYEDIGTPEEFEELKRKSTLMTGRS